MSRIIFIHCHSIKWGISDRIFVRTNGSIIPIVATCYGYVALYTKLHGQLFSSIIKLMLPEPFIYQISGVLVLIGMIVGMVGSLRAVRKYLKI